MGYKGRHVVGRGPLPPAAAYAPGVAKLPAQRTVDELEDTVPMVDPWADYEMPWAFTPARALEGSA